MSAKKIMTTNISALKKYTSSILLVALLCAMVGIVWFGILPLKKSLLNKARIVQEFYAGEENQAKQVGRLSELRNQFTTIEENESTLNILLKEEQIVDFIKTPESLARETDIQMTITSKDNGKITESKPLPIKTPTAIATDANTDASSTKKTKTADILEDISFDRYLRLSISASGKYKNVANFLHKIETLPIGLDIVGIEIKRKDQEKQKNVSATGMNSVPSLFMSGAQSTTSVSMDIPAENLLEGTFDLLVYVNK
jgi:Tfp pilus assembly protein PilO